jgi:hypothetical protein
MARLMPGLLLYVLEPFLIIACLSKALEARSDVLLAESHAYRIAPFKTGDTGCNKSSRPPAISPRSAFHADSYLPYQKQELCKRDSHHEFLEI